MGEPLYNFKFFLPTIRKILPIKKKCGKANKPDFSKTIGKNLSYTYTVKANYLNKAVT